MQGLLSHEGREGDRKGLYKTSLFFSHHCAMFTYLSSSQSQLSQEIVQHNKGVSEMRKWL